MTTPPKAVRYHVARVERPAPPPDAGSGPFDTAEDGFGNMDFRRPEAAAGVQGATVLRVPRDAAPPSQPADEVEAALSAIAAEGLTGRQLRRARQVAQKQGLTVSSDLDAVRQLRLAGIDPFSRASMLDMVSPSPRPDDSPPPGKGAARPQGRDLARLPGDLVQLPQNARQIAVPSPQQRAEVNQAAEILRMQQDIARRRRRRLALLATRLFVFVLLPTILAGWYFYRMATPMFATRSEFVIQHAQPASTHAGGGGLFSGTAMATAQDSIAVQGYLQSLEAMQRLEADQGFREFFQSEAIDPLQRLPADASMDDAYKIYKRYVKVSYDSNEGIVRMEVVASDPQVAARWAEQLISYAEEQVDHLTQRLRADQMRDAQEGYDTAREELTNAQLKLLELQERYKVLSSDVEAGLITGQISALESQVTTERLSLAEMEANENPNLARMEPIKRRIATLEAEITQLRAKLTEGEAGGVSVAEMQGDLLLAEADVETRQMILTQALQAMENSRVEANRQVRYLSLSVRPVPPDAAAYPRAFENTIVTLLIMLGIYLMVSMTAAILREQVSA